MPALDLDRPGVSAVETFGKVLNELVEEATAANDAEIPNIASRAEAALPAVEANTEDEKETEAAKTRQFAIVESAARDLFDRLIATTPIEAPEFDKMWHFLDILSVLSDDGVCDPALVFWLIEELLDSQTITGCRVIFDYLESRRERITAKHFKQKNLVILRSCNELLRRLSRAEDTTFCGRVFIFMFQSFPLGDRSSVNLRGEYHVENVTTYEKEDPAAAKADEAAAENESMDVDMKDANGDAKEAAKTKEDAKRVDPNVLYPMFWSLQESFSQPLKLFEASHFAGYKTSLETTMKAFEALQQDGPRNLKRKADEDAPDAFNPKYLTSRDLFELEISDLSFRRHVLVQALIVTDFLLSQSAQGKDKVTVAPGMNKAVLYAGQLSEEDTKWATEMKRRISEYLRKGFDGPYFYRMVETVLARDKNWVFWKMASCPNIQMPPVTPADFAEARSSATRLATSKRLRPVPMGAVSMDFLKSDDVPAALAALGEEERYKMPALETLEHGIANDDFEIGMPTTSNEAKALAVESKASKSWRAMRIAARSKLASFDKIEDPKNISVVFQDAPPEDDEAQDAEPAADESAMPPSRTPLLVAGDSAHEVVTALQDKRKGVFGVVVRHTTRATEDGEANGKDFHFVTPAEFNMLRDGDRLVEYNETTGTSSKAVDAVVEAGKVPVLQVDAAAGRFARDMGFEARYVLLKDTSEEDGEGFDLVLEKGDDAADKVDAFVYAAEDANMEDAEANADETKAEDKAGEDEEDSSEDDGEDDDAEEAKEE